MGVGEITAASAARTYGNPRGLASVESRVRQLQLRLPHLMRTHRVPGVAVAVVSQRELVWARGFGVRRRGGKKGVDPDTVMEACSMSKPFFGYLVLKLVERRQFDIDRQLVKYLGGDYVPNDPRGRAITGRMALTHTTGLPNWRSGGWRSNSPLSLAFEPGAGFRYSGEGYLMLQRAVEMALDSDLDTLANKRLIKPLGMVNTRYVWDPHMAENAAAGHDADGEEKTKRRHFDRANAAFTLYTSAEDYARFLVEILREDRDGEHSISAATRREMLTPVAHRDEQDADWGLGWGLSRFQGRRRVYHGGANGTGFRCLSEFFPESGDGLVIMTNAIGGKALCAELVESWHCVP